MIQAVRLAGLLKLELPGQTVRLVDGGTLTVAGETYLSRDATMGTIAALDALNEGVGEEAPAGLITFNPPDSVNASVLMDPAWQGARLRLWIAEVGDDGAPVGTPDQQADWIVDQPSMVLGRGKRQLEMMFVSGGQRLFQRDRGNSLSPAFHKSVHPGETGLDNASGVATSVPWGAPSAPRGITSAGGAAGITPGSIVSRLSRGAF